MTGNLTFSVSITINKTEQLFRIIFARHQKTNTCRLEGKTYEWNVIEKVHCYSTQEECMQWLATTRSQYYSVTGWGSTNTWNLNHAMENVIFMCRLIGTLVVQKRNFLYNRWESLYEKRYPCQRQCLRGARDGCTVVLPPPWRGQGLVNHCVSELKLKIIILEI